MAAEQKKAPDFTLEQINGGTIRLSDLLKKGEAVLVFWATWCPHCRAEIPHIEKFYKENKEKVALLSINSGESKTKVLSFVQKKGISYPVALDPDSSVAKLYGVVGIPTIVAIDKNSNIIYMGHSMQEMETKIGKN